MPDYSVKFLIDSKDLKAITDAKQKITIAKPVSGGSPNVVWLSIAPFQSTDVSWTEEYGIYASDTRMENGAVIEQLSQTEEVALDGTYYTFTANRVFNGPFTDDSLPVPAGSYGTRNEMPHKEFPSLTFGLTQSALVNQKPIERKPLSATPVLANQYAEMTPYTIVYAWLQSQFESETIITRITGKSAKITLGRGVKDITLRYNTGLGMFAPVSGRGDFQMDHAAVELLTADVY